jgi:16S rRNA C967 or C1407 C5-methylase (RsmB/RsmF family)
VLLIACLLTTRFSCRSAEVFNVCFVCCDARKLLGSTRDAWHYERGGVERTTTQVTFAEASFDLVLLDALCSGSGLVHLNFSRLLSH